MFSRVLICPQGGLPLEGEDLPLEGGDLPLEGGDLPLEGRGFEFGGRGSAWRGRPPCTPPEIRSTGGQYASYWNAFWFR